MVGAERVVIGGDGPGGARRRGAGHEARPLGTVVPRPGVAEPKHRQDVQHRRLRAAVVHRDTNMDLAWKRLRVDDLDVPIAAVPESAAIHQAEGWRASITATILFNQPAVRVFGLRIFVEVAQPAMGRRRVEVEVILLHVFAVIALVAGEPEGAFFEDRIALVPQGETKAKELPVVAQSGEAVLAPAIGAG